jgi:hypothetical protein
MQYTLRSFQTSLRQEQHQMIYIYDAKGAEARYAFFFLIIKQKDTLRFAESWCLASELLKGTSPNSLEGWLAY